MDTFSIVQRSLNATANDADRDGLDHRTLEYGRVVKAVQVVVDALTPPDGGRYIVAFADISTAATALGERRIVVSSKPLIDQSLSMVEKAVVIATFAAHEIGHTLITKPRNNAARTHNAHSGYHAVANLADDVILEAYLEDLYPILKDAFAFTGLWVLRSTAANLPKVETGVWKDTPGRFNTILSGCRYGDIPQIVWATPRARNERDWARDWASRLITSPVRDDATYLALCDEAWERIRTREEPPEPEPEPIIDEPEPGEGEPDDDDGTEPGGDGDGEDGEPEPTDEDGEPKGEGEGKGQPGGDMADPNDAPRDWDDGEGEPNPGEDTDGKEGDGEGGGGNAKANADDLRPEDDFDATAIEDSLHDSGGAGHWWENQTIEEAIRQYDNTGVTAFGKHGRMTTTWE